MWVFTNGGFYSAVQHRKDSDLLMVRARDKQSLETLVEDLGKQGELEIYLEKGSDYPWRVVISKVQWVTFLEKETMDYLIYDNFKSSLTATRGKVWHDAAMAVWSAMHRVQDTRDHILPYVSTYGKKGKKGKSSRGHSWWERDSHSTTGTGWTFHGSEDFADEDEWLKYLAKEDPDSSAFIH